MSRSSELWELAYSINSSSGRYKQLFVQNAIYLTDQTVFSIITKQNSTAADLFTGAELKNLLIQGKNILASLDASGTFYVTRYPLIVSYSRDDLFLNKVNQALAEKYAFTCLENAFLSSVDISSLNLIGTLKGGQITGTDITFTSSTGIDLTNGTINLGNGVIQSGQSTFSSIVVSTTLSSNYFSTTSAVVGNTLTTENLNVQGTASFTGSSVTVSKDFSCSGNVSFNSSSSTVKVSGSTTFSGASVTVDKDLTCSGVATFSGATMSVSNNIIASGTARFTGASVTVDKDLTCSGVATFSGATMSISNALTCSGNTTFTGATTLVNNAFTASGTAKFSGTSVTIDKELTCAGVATFTGTVMNISNNITTSGTASFTGSSVSITKDFTSSGNVNFNGATSTFGVSGITNLSGSSVTITNALICNGNISSNGTANFAVPPTIGSGTSSDLLIGEKTTNTLKNKTLDAAVLTGSSSAASLAVSGSLESTSSASFNSVTISGPLSVQHDANTDFKLNGKKITFPTVPGQLALVSDITNTLNSTKLTGTTNMDTIVISTSFTSNGTASFTSAPTLAGTDTLIGANTTNTLKNKTLNAAVLTGSSSAVNLSVSGTLSSSGTASFDSAPTLGTSDTLIGANTTNTLKNKTLDAAALTGSSTAVNLSVSGTLSSNGTASFASAPTLGTSDSLIGANTTNILTNKTLDAAILTGSSTAVNLSVSSSLSSTSLASVTLSGPVSIENDSNFKLKGKLITFPTVAGQLALKIDKNVTFENATLIGTALCSGFFNSTGTSSFALAPTLAIAGKDSDVLIGANTENTLTKKTLNAAILTGTTETQGILKISSSGSVSCDGTATFASAPVLGSGSSIDKLVGEKTINTLINKTIQSAILSGETNSSGDLKISSSGSISCAGTATFASAPVLGSGSSIDKLVGEKTTNTLINKTLDTAILTGETKAAGLTISGAAVFGTDTQGGASSASVKFNTTSFMARNCSISLPTSNGQLVLKNDTDVTFQNTTLKNTTTVENFFSSTGTSSFAVAPTLAIAGKDSDVLIGANTENTLTKKTLNGAILTGSTVSNGDLKIAGVGGSFTCDGTSSFATVPSLGSGNTLDKLVGENTSNTLKNKTIDAAILTGLSTAANLSISGTFASTTTADLNAVTISGSVSINNDSGIQLNQKSITFPTVAGQLALKNDTDVTFQTTTLNGTTTATGVFNSTGTANFGTESMVGASVKFNTATFMAKTCSITLPTVAGKLALKNDSDVTFQNATLTGSTTVDALSVSGEFAVNNRVISFPTSSGTLALQSEVETLRLQVEALTSMFPANNLMTASAASSSVPANVDKAGVYFITSSDVANTISLLATNAGAIIQLREISSTPQGYTLNYDDTSAVIPPSASVVCISTVQGDQATGYAIIVDGVIIS